MLCTAIYESNWNSCNGNCLLPYAFRFEIGQGAWQTLTYIQRECRENNARSSNKLQCTEGGLECGRNIISHSNINHTQPDWQHITTNVTWYFNP